MPACYCLYTALVSLLLAWKKSLDPPVQKQSKTGILPELLRYGIVNGTKRGSNLAGLFGGALDEEIAKFDAERKGRGLGNGTVDFIADSLEGQECQRIRRADQPKADMKRAAGIKAMNEFMPIFNISKFSNPRELKKILKGDLELQYEWHRFRELRSDKRTRISPLANLSKKPTKAELANVIVAALTVGIE
ncbi:hypothetical protein B0H13DRAFT_1869543 [Mycena leptocephala]|nr:hypothetical protein B0H13DRAFT_1869543 [Mycena leptocephala]